MKDRFKMKQILLFWCLLCVLGCGRRDYETIVVRGSDTEVNLVLLLAEAYMDQHPNVSIAVTGGGSGTGIAALINRSTDIANSSRALHANELELAENRGIQAVPVVFAEDALCFIVHQDLPLDSVSTSQLRDIYTGRYTHWSELGGPDLPISLYGRQGNSGTFIYIQEHVLKGDYSEKMKQMNGTSQIIESIRTDKAGIGYVGLGYIADHQGNKSTGVKALSIRGDHQEKAFSPLEPEHILDGSYAIVRPLYQYMDGKPAGRLKDFLLFELSEVGQEIIRENGYFPVSEKYRSLNASSLANGPK